MTMSKIVQAQQRLGIGWDISFSVLTTVLKTGSMTEPEKLPGHGSLVGPVVEL